MTKKNVLKIAGNILVLGSLIFIIKKFSGFDIDYSILTQPANIARVLLIGFLYGLAVIALALPWKRTVYILTKENIPFMGVANVFVKANLMKYLPGNVVQFIGRNELAVQYQLKHADIATSTLVDTLVSLAASSVLAVVFYFPGFCQIIEKYHFNYKLLVAAFAGLAAVLLILFFLRRKLAGYLSTLKELFRLQSILVLITNCLYDVVVGACTSMLYIWILVGITGQEWGFPVHIVLGAVSLSSIAGFITPGAPGGIGIREAVLSILLAGVVDVKYALLAIVIFRLTSVIGDVAAFLMVQLMQFLENKGK